MRENRTEKQLIEGCRRGDRQAQERLYQEYKVYLFGVAMRYSKTRNEAQDVLQEGFYRIFKDLGQFSGTSSFKGWMRKVVINAALMFIRKHHKVRYLAVETNDFDGMRDADTSLIQIDRAQAIIRLIQNLPRVQQTVFNLRAIDGYSFKEIADQLEVKESTLRSHFLRARTQLQNMLKLELENDG